MPYAASAIPFDPVRGLIQIAGVHDPDEARMVAACGADWIGIPLRLPVHREDVTDAEAAAVCRTLPPGAAPVLITYLDTAGAVIELARLLGVRIVQLHGPVPLAQLRALRAADPLLTIVKSLVVAADNADALAAEARQAAPWVDAFITDTFDPATGASGATGKTHDWRVSRRLVETSARPVILAGGLHPANVAAAVGAVRPAGVDAHTGVEGPDGRKSEPLVRAFVERAREAFRRASSP